MRRYAYLAIAVFFAAIQFSPVQAQLKRVGALYVEGEITMDNQQIGDVQIEVFQENELISTIQSDAGGYYKLRLRFNHSYTIEFSKEGALSKRIYFDTSMKKRYTNVPEYEMFIDLIPATYLQNVNHGALEFPMAIIKYNSSKGEFEHIPEYTHQMEFLVTKLLAESAIKKELEEIQERN